MKNFVRFASLFLALVLVFSLAVPAFALTSNQKPVYREGYYVYRGQSFYFDTSVSASISSATSNMQCDDTTYRTQCSISVNIKSSDGTIVTESASSTLAYATSRSVSIDNTFWEDGVFCTGTISSAVGSYFIEGTTIWTLSVS